LIFGVLCDKIMEMYTATSHINVSNQQSQQRFL